MFGKRVVFLNLFDLAGRWGLESLDETQRITELLDFPYGWRTVGSSMREWNLTRVQEWERGRAFATAFPAIRKEAAPAKKARKR